MSSFNMFASLDEKAEMVARWPGYTPEDVDAAIQAARDNGTIVGYERERRKNHFLDLVFVPYQATPLDTLLYLIDRNREVWGSDFPLWQEGYGQGAGGDWVQLIPGARPFTPNRLVLVAIGFGDNWRYPQGRLLIKRIQADQAGKLEDFGVLANAVQSPNWVRCMDSYYSVPYCLAGALIITTPGSIHSPAYCPVVLRTRSRPSRLCLGAQITGIPKDYYAMPVRRNYGRK